MAGTFTAPTLSAVDEANLETFKQVYEVLDTRIGEIAADKSHGRITERVAKSTTETAKKLMQLVSDKANDITGCPLGIWLD